MIKSYLFSDRQKVITTLPTFEVNISDRKLMVLWKFFRNFPLPTSTSIGGIGEDVMDGAMLTSVSLVGNCFATFRYRTVPALVG